MTTTQHKDDGRTETKRFDADTTDDLAVTNLREGDRIDPHLVARTMNGLGERLSATRDAATAQLAECTITNAMDDIHTAILVDGETGAMALASRHDSQSAWNQLEADWKVRDIGMDVRVTDADWTGDDTADPDQAATSWADVVLCDCAHGHDDYADEVRVGRRTIKLKNPYDGESATGTLHLE
jgi:hypothetical protein